MKIIFGAQKSKCSSRVLMTNSLDVLRELDLKAHTFTASLLARHKAQPPKLTGTLKIDLVSHNADDCDSLCLMGAAILSRTKIVVVCDASSLPSPLRCYH